jgi:hypothetical protein
LAQALALGSKRVTLRDQIIAPALPVFREPMPYHCRSADNHFLEICHAAFSNKSDWTGSLRARRFSQDFLVRSAVLRRSSGSAHRESFKRRHHLRSSCIRASLRALRASRSVLSVSVSARQIAGARHLRHVRASLEWRCVPQHWQRILKAM